MNTCLDIALSDCGSKSWTCRFIFLSGSDLSRITMLGVPERTPEGSLKSPRRALAHAFYGPWGLIFSAMPPGPPSPAIQFLLTMTYACDKGHRHDFLLSLSNSVITFEWNRTAPLELWALHHSWNSFGDVQGWKLRKGHWGSRLVRRHAALYTVKAGAKSGSQKMNSVMSASWDLRAGVDRSTLQHDVCDKAAPPSVLTKVAPGFLPYIKSRQYFSTLKFKRSVCQHLTLRTTLGSWIFPHSWFSWPHIIHFIFPASPSPLLSPY